MFAGETLHPTTMAIAHPPVQQAVGKRRVCSEGGKNKCLVWWENLYYTAGDDDDGERVDGLKEKQSTIRLARITHSLVSGLP